MVCYYLWEEEMNYDEYSYIVLCWNDSVETGQRVSGVVYRGFKRSVVVIFVRAIICGNVLVKKFICNKHQIYIKRVSKQRKKNSLLKMEVL